MLRTNLPALPNFTPFHSKFILAKLPDDGSVCIFLIVTLKKGLPSPRLGELGGLVEPGDRLKIQIDPLPAPA